MGVVGVTKVIKELAPKSIKQMKYTSFNGKSVAVDTLLQIYRFIIGMVGRGQLKRSDGKVTTHIQGFFHKIVNLLTNGIYPIFVIDGDAPSIKEVTLEKRRLMKQKAEDMLDSIPDEIDNESRIKLEKRAITVTRDQIADVKKLCTLFGLPFIQAPEEADPQCAALNIVNKVYGVVSEDSDVLFFGAPRLLKNFSSKNKYVDVIDLEILLKDLDLTYEQWVEYGILLGCDYCPQSIKGLKGKSAYKKYKEHGSMAKLIKAIQEENRVAVSKGKTPKYEIHDSFLNSWEAAKEYYIKAGIYNPQTGIDFTWKKPDYEGLITFMVRDHEFNKKIVKRGLDKVMKVYSRY